MNGRSTKTKTPAEIALTYPNASKRRPVHLAHIPPHPTTLARWAQIEWELQGNARRPRGRPRHANPTRGALNTRAWRLRESQKARSKPLAGKRSQVGTRDSKRKTPASAPVLSQEAA